MRISVIVTRRADGGRRDRIWDWVERRYETLLPRVELVVVEDDEPDGGFNHPRLINIGASRAHGDVFVVADADLIPQPTLIRVGAQNAQRYGWAMPRLYVQLNERASTAILERVPSDPVKEVTLEDTVWVGDRVSVAPFVFVTRDVFEKVGGYDDRYPDWGSDDGAFSVIVTTLHGPVQRFEGSTLHLWHERGRDADSNVTLTRRYIDASGDVEAVRRIRDEAR